MHVYSYGGQRGTLGVVPQDRPALLVEIGCLTHEAGWPVSLGEPPLSVSMVLNFQACAKVLVLSIGLGIKGGFPNLI